MDATSFTSGPGAANANAPIRVSVVMLVCKRPQFIGRALRSVLEQDYQEWEVILVQQGEDRRVEAVATEWSSRDRRILYFRRENPESIARAYNFGVENARGEYIAILDDDDYWIALHKLRCQVEFLDTHADYVACGGGMAVIDETGMELMRYLKPQRDEQIRKFALIANPMAHSTTMFRRHVQERVNLYREALSGLPDWDFWLTLGQRGKLYNFPELFTGYTLWRRSISFQRQKGNAKAALNIVWRHRRSYAHFGSAMALAMLYYAYAHLPLSITGRSFSFFSRLKKSAFAGRSEGQSRPSTLSSTDTI